jgi:MGT family glycosyltransferase
MRVLLAAHPTVGHTNALITIGRRLLARGADVRFALPALPRPPFRAPEIVETATRLPDTIAAAGLRVVRLRPAYRSLAYAVVLPLSRGATELRLAARLFSSGAAHYTRALEAELDVDGADVVVADYLFFPAWLAAERRGLPFVALYHSALPFPHDGRPAFANADGLVRTLDRRLGDVRAALGLPPAPARLLERPYSPHLNILATAPALEGRDDDLGPHTHYVGPCTDGRVEPTGDFPFARLRADAFKVYVSLGTVFNGSPSHFLALIRGIAGPGVQVVVSAGASYEALKDLASDDILVFRRVPQLAVLRAVDAVVTHGGNNTVNESLAAGRPLLVLPIGGEQEANARRVEAIGAGIALDRARLSPEHVGRAFARLRGDAGFGVRARGIAAALEGMGGAEAAAARIAELATERD